MSLIPEEHKAHLKEELQRNMTESVRIVVFTQEMECEFCRESRQLAQEVASLMPDKILVEIYDFVKDEAKAREYGVDKVPAVIVLGKKDYGIRYYGIPYGYEFNTLIETIINVSKGATNLSEDTKAKLKGLDKPVHIQVFVTLTCPYCPVAAGLSHKFAIESDMVKSDVVEVGEFPHLAQKYSVMGVPKIVINERTELVGAVPEAQFVAHVLQASKPPSIYM
ncbi:MAG TPA: thioredoxin family protein [Candidatus Bathyarchaeia archaeon]|nr:thioredoxin family protein [Candidatus Bathyarchaeia archaeon]